MRKSKVFSCLPVGIERDHSLFALFFDNTKKKVKSRILTWTFVLNGVNT